MKGLSKTVLAVLATGVLSCAVFSQQAQATAIQGNINFAGGVLLTSTIVTHNTSFLSISGTGIVSGNGFDPTNMDWSFTTQSSGGRTHTLFSFSANGVAVPDSGSAVALLGLALIGIEVLRRKLRN